MGCQNSNFNIGLSLHGCAEKYTEQRTHWALVSMNKNDAFNKHSPFFCWSKVKFQLYNFQFHLLLSLVLKLSNDSSYNSNHGRGKFCHCPFLSFISFLPGWEVEKEGEGLFWRGACLLRGVSSLPAIKRKLRVNPPSLPRLITIYPHSSYGLKSKISKESVTEIYCDFFQIPLQLQLWPPTPLFSFACKLLSLLAEISTILQLYLWNFDFSTRSSTSSLPNMCLHQNGCQRGRRVGEKDKKNKIQTNKELSNNSISNKSTSEKRCRFKDIHPTKEHACEEKKTLLQ